MKIEEELQEEWLGNDFAEYATDPGDFIKTIDIWRILFCEREIFPCQGFGFIIETVGSEIYYDGLGRRIGDYGALIKYIELMGGVLYEEGEDDPSFYYRTLCQITKKEFEEMQKINLTLELKNTHESKRTNRKTKRV